jgi:hypothetical protein
MKKTTRITAMIALFLCASYVNANDIQAENNSQQSVMNDVASGKILELNPGAKSGLLMDGLTGEVVEFQYAGLEVLEVNVEYVYIKQVTAKGKIIIRDIHRK